jgi:aminoglycoside phosphotransferase (APT) family kinase protein
VLAQSDGLGRGFVCDYVAGETLGRRIVRDAAFADVRPGLAARCGRILARIHSLPAPALPLLMAVPPLESLYATYSALNSRSAVFELAFRWLHRNAPDSSIRPRLVHGDFRNGNLIIGSDGVRAVLDWELTHIGDPAEDLGWMTVNSWRFGESAKPVGGFGSIEDLLEGYRCAGGDPTSPERVRYWQALGSLRWGVMCGKLSSQPNADEPITVERAMIGRRASEAEIDLLTLIAGGEKDE